MLGRLKFEIGPLVNEMLDQLPEAVWTSTSTTFFDPAMAGGQFVVEIERRLRKYGHSDTNIAGRVYGCESHAMSVNYAKKKHGLIGRYSAVPYDQLLNGEFKMKFDVIVGNPPYQDTAAKKAGADRKVGNKLWYQFIFKSSELVNPNGYITMVSPNQWMSGGTNQRKGSIGVLKDLFAKNQLVYAKVAGVTEKYFKNIGIGISWWIYKNAPSTKNTVIDLEDKSIEINLKDIEFLSPDPNSLSISIVNKILATNNEKFENWYFSTQSTPGEFKETSEPTKKNIYPHWIMGSTITKNLSIMYFPVDRSAKARYKKILFPMSTRYWQPHLDLDSISVASHGQALKVPDNTTVKGFRSVFYSKLFTYLCFNLQVGKNGFMKTVLVRALPKLDMSRCWTDAELYQHFNLTDEEIAYIEANVK